MDKKFYITTAIDYTNDTIHIGHIYQKVIADCLARYHRLIGDKVFFLTGTDEHGGKVEESAKTAGFEGKEKEFVDQIAKSDEAEQKSINISFDRFLRTTDSDHVNFCIEFWKKVDKNNDIYLAEYEGIYCEGCEAFLTKSDLVDNHCPFHPNASPKTIKEKNYFFRWSKYADFLKEYITSHPEFIWPEERKNEMLSFIKHGIQDIPISRPKIKFGIPVPNDPSQTIYVWFDALINYLTAAPEGFWPADIHVLGKDNTRWHALLWPAMLKSAGYELPKTILVNGFLTLNGQKISKSLGNVIRASELVKQFGDDAIRYYLIKSKPVYTDGDVRIEKIKECYNADLANGLGNLVSRVAALCQRSGFEFEESKLEQDSNWKRHIESYHLNEAIERIWTYVNENNKQINESKWWELKGPELQTSLQSGVDSIRKIAYHLQPFLPDTSQKILDQFKGPVIKPGLPLFPRI